MEERFESCGHVAMLMQEKVELGTCLLRFMLFLPERIIWPVKSISRYMPKIDILIIVFFCSFSG